MPVKILTVSLSKTAISVIKDTLREYLVLSAADTMEAMQQLDRHADLATVIIDLDLPDREGFRLLDTLHSYERYQLTVILLTHHSGFIQEINDRNLGVVDYITMPIRKEFLRARVELHLGLIQQKSDKQSILARNQIYDQIFQQAPIGIAISYSDEDMGSSDRKMMTINAMFERIIGRSNEELSRLGWEMITHPDDLDTDLEHYRKLQSGEIQSYSMEKRYIKPDGSVVWVHMRVARLNISHERRYHNICLIQDITKRKETEAALAESERGKSVLLSHLPGMAYKCYYDREWTMQFVSDGCFELTGYPQESLIYNKDMSYNMLIAPEYREALWKEWENILEKRLPFKYEYEIITAGGEKKWVLEMGQGIFSQRGEVESLEGIILDISDRKAIEDNLRYTNEHDVWTGLYNRRYLERLLKNDAKKETRTKRALVSINLNTMHSVITTYGFHYSQKLIKKVADALKIHSNDHCLLFKTYENRFVFDVKEYKNQKELIAFSKAVSDTLEAQLAIEGIGGGIGIIEIDEDNQHDIDQLLKNLLVASERAAHLKEKEFGYCFFDLEMEKRLIREEEITRELYQIAAGDNKGRLFLQFQPILDLKADKICGFEALARLRSEKLGLIPPLEFIPITEKTKLIIPLGELIIRQAFQFLNRLNVEGDDDICVSINISAIQLLREGFVESLFETINKMEVNPANICLEITESIFAANYQEINSILREINACGIQMAIDDFGTGYSSLSRERELNVNCLKIDKYFIDKLLWLQEDQAITGDIIAMAHKLGHYVVAEGVEDEKQKQYLKKYQCDKIQGYLISKPLDDEKAIALLREMNQRK